MSVRPLLPALLALLGLWLAPSVASAEGASSDAEACVASYQSGDYRGAALCFERLEAAGHLNGPLLYNQGNAWYRAGEVGRSLLAWRRAELLTPRDGDLAANIATARARARDDLAPPDLRGPLLRVLLLPIDRAAPAELLLLGAFAWALLCALLALRVARPGSGLGLPIVAVALLAAGGLLGWGSRTLALERSPVAVVLAPEVALRSGRDLQSRDLALLHEAAEVAVVEREAGWVQVSLSSGQRGWLPAESVGLVTLEPPNSPAL